MANTYRSGSTFSLCVYNWWIDHSSTYLWRNRHTSSWLEWWIWWWWGEPVTGYDIYVPRLADQVRKHPLEGRNSSINNHTATLAPLGCVILYTSKRGSGHFWNINVKVIATSGTRDYWQCGFRTWARNWRHFDQRSVGGERVRTTRCINEHMHKQRWWSDDQVCWCGTNTSILRW